MVTGRYQEKDQDMGKPHRTFTLEQIKCHDSSHDLWMVIYNKVYDVTTFASSHPGSAEILFDCGGVDATEAFEDVAHSDDAFQMLKPYFIGDLAPDDCRTYSVSRDLSSNIDFADNILKKDDKCKQLRNKFKLPNNFLEKLSIILLVIIAMFSVVLYLSIQKMKWSCPGQL